MAEVVSLQLGVAMYRPFGLLAAVFLVVFPAEHAIADCAPLPVGLTDWWPADASANDIVSTNNGILQGGAAATAAGMVGSAFQFDGTNSYVQIPDAPAFHPTNFTLECWVRFASLASA